MIGVFVFFSSDYPLTLDIHSTVTPTAVHLMFFEGTGHHILYQCQCDHQNLNWFPM